MTHLLSSRSTSLEEMAEGPSQDMWTPYKELQETVDCIITGQVADPMKNLDNCLQKFKQCFINLLKNPPKNAQSREILKKGIIEGINIPGMGFVVLSKDIVDEAIIISDMYDLNEYQALDLLHTAQRQMPQHPGLPRGLVAVLLYYDGRRALVSTLRTLVQARNGVAWSLDVNPAVTDYITDYTTKLMEDGLINKILDTLNSMDLARELDLLQQNRAFGGPKHHRQIVDLLEVTRQILADIIYCWAAQCGLPREPTIRLIQQLKRTKLEEDSVGGIDGVTLALQMALLCALDLSILQRREDGEEAVQLLPLMSDPDFQPALHRELSVNAPPWQSQGLQALTYLAWGLVIATMRLTQHSQPVQGLLDEDDLLMDTAVNLGVFDFLQRTFLQNANIYKEEVYLRRLHCLITDFIVFMPLKVKELRNRAEEAARTTQAYAQEGLDPPSHLSHHFEQLLLAIARLYRDDPLHLGLALDYWCPTEGSSTSTFPFRSHTRQVSLFKFVRSSADNLSASLYVAYMRMLCSLASSPQAARHCYNLLKQNGPVSGCTISWDHFFTSLNRYYCNLRQELPPKADTVYHHRIHPKGITPQEIQGLQAVLCLVRAVAEHDEISRAALCESPTWQPLAMLLGLISCSVPIALKAELVLTLAALANAPDTAAALWVSIEAAQILTTIPSTSSYQARGIQTELEEMESRSEEFPLTRAMLKLLDVLTNYPVPRLLGVGSRPPGFSPYFNYVLHSVFLRALTRAYKQPQEKWEITKSCLNLFVKFLNQYDPEPEDFCGPRIEVQGGGSSQVNPPPGFHLMVDLHSKSELLRLILYFLDEGCALLDTYAPVSGKEALEASMLGCLQLLQRALTLQQRFLSLLNGAGSNLLLTGLNRLLLGINPRSGDPDHLVSIAKYVTYNTWLPRHALAAVNVLLSVTSYPTPAGQLVGMFTANQTRKTEIRHGFVECLETDDDASVDEGKGEEDTGVILQTKEMILKLIQTCLGQAAPNFAHYLLGFDLNKDVSKTVFQQPGVVGFPRTCLHSVLFILDSSLKFAHVSGTEVTSSTAAQARLLEAAYGLLYNLCAGNRTSQPVLRFLRTPNNFLARHLAALPFNGPHRASELSQMSWLLKMVAIELKVSATRMQHSHLSSLARILVSSHEEKARGHSDGDELIDIPSISSLSFVGDMDNKPYDKLMLQLLALLDFSPEQISSPSWEFFEPKQVEQVFIQCENTLAPGLKLVDVKRLHRILMEELAAVQGNSSAVQRQLIIEEIQAVLKYALSRNKQRTQSHANIRFMDAWRQVVGVVFCVAPLEVLPCPGRLQIVLDTLHLLINKVLSGQMNSELANLTSNALLLLLVNLRHSYVLGERSQGYGGGVGSDESLAPAQREIDSMVLAGGMVTSRAPETSAHTGSGSGRAVLEENSAKLNVILSGILQWMLGSGVASQKLRSNLYSSLLSFLHIVCLPERSRQPDGSSAMVLPDPHWSLGGVSNNTISLTSPRQERKSTLQASLDLVLGFGEGVVDVMCHDGTGGHDVCKMLALSCLDKLIELDPHSSWVSFLSARGYLKYLIDSLMDSDADGQLEAMLHASPESLRPLYVYESKMALLCRVAATRMGAEMLLEQKALSVIASMKVFDHHPIMHSGITESTSGEFIPSVGNRYLQILLPAIHLCDACLTSLGTENQSCVVQVMHFVLSHVQTVGLVLGSASPLLPLNYLKELVHVTGIIARSANPELYGAQPDDYPAALDRKAHLLRIQTLMLALFPHFIICEPMLRKLGGFGQTSQNEARRQENDRTSEEKGEAVLYVLQVAAHLLLYARNLAGCSRADIRSVLPVFKPSMATQRTHSHTSGEYGSSLGLLVGDRGGESQPTLGVIVEQLVASVNHHRTQRGALELLTRKLASLPELSTMELQEILPEGTSAVEKRAVAAQQLKHSVLQKERELSLTSYIIDNCLYLVWMHLDFYLNRGLPQPRPGANLDNSLLQISGAPLNATWQVSVEDISQMKQSLVSVFNDTFSKNLVDTKQNQTETEKGFVEALLRRIKRLLQFVPVK